MGISTLLTSFSYVKTIFFNIQKFLGDGKVGKLDLSKLVVLLWMNLKNNNYVNIIDLCYAWNVRIMNRIDIGLGHIYTWNIRSMDS